MEAQWLIGLERGRERGREKQRKPERGCERQTLVIVELLLRLKIIMSPTGICLSFCVML